MKKKTILPVTRGELRAITITSFVICFSVILPPHLARILQPIPAPQIEITELQIDNFTSGSTTADYPAPSGDPTETYNTYGNSKNRILPGGVQSRSETTGRYPARSFNDKINNKHGIISTRRPCNTFDPNSIPGDSLEAWGVSSFTVRNILKYRTSGGRYRKPEDLQRVYGMDSITYRLILGCIKIENEIVQSVFVNTADTSQWMSLPGIGPVLSRRIVRFRDMLGGFYTVDQVADTYGLPVETFESIRGHLRMRSVPKALNLITATEAQLAAHPYISLKQARVMINYFNQHGRPQSLDDLDNLYIADSLWLARISPYLTLDTAIIN